MGHSSRPLRLGPDGWLYTAIGADCNVCEPTTARDQTILRFDLRTGREEIVASGFRNVAHFDWQPETNAMFATEVGVDYAGEDFPLEELNEIQPGGFYGFPYLHGPDFPDPELAPGRADRIAAAIPPVHTFTAHSTPLGVSFLRSPGFPDEYRGSALVVLKGSWNRERKSGYKVISLHWVEASDGTRQIEEREFIVGFERDEHVIGRPVDIVEGPDGSLYLSDDMAGAIYRIRYEPSALKAEDGENGNVFALQVESPEILIEPLSRLSAAERTILIEHGKELFDRHACADCHAASSSRPEPVPLVDLAARRSIGDLIEALRSPPASMPRALLSDEERWALAIFLLGREGDTRFASKD
jgi:mono/diheme cytochrome c family protein